MSDPHKHRGDALMSFMREQEKKTRGGNLEKESLQKELLVKNRSVSLSPSLQGLRWMGLRVQG